MADGSGAGGQTLGEEFLVFEDEALELTFLGGERIKGLDVELSETFDVDRAAILRVQRLDWARQRETQRARNKPCPSCDSIGGNTCRPPLSP